MTILLTLAIFALALPTNASELPPAEAAKIEYLIDSIGELEDAQFIRNGKAHEAVEAAAHLRRKLKAAGSRIRSAEDFIIRCASASSMTGRPYRIRFGDGREIDSAQFLRQKLAEYSTMSTGASGH